MARLSSYLDAVNGHKPGTLDMAARLTGFMGEGDLAEVRTDFFALVAVCKRQLGQSVRPAPIDYRDTIINFADLRQLLGLTDEEAHAGNANRILHRAAILHADVAMLVIPLLPGRTGCSARATLLVQDGNSAGAGCIGIPLGPRPPAARCGEARTGQRRGARLWYLATITYLLEIGDFANSNLQIDRARLLFPDDPEILFEHGYYHEGFASPHVQPAAFESGADKRGAKVHLDEADDLYRRAIKENPRFVEARVRRGYVLGLLGQHQDGRRGTPPGRGVGARAATALLRRDVSRTGGTVARQPRGGSRSLRSGGGALPAGPVAVARARAAGPPDGRSRGSPARHAAGARPASHTSGR